MLAPIKQGPATIFDHLDEIVGRYFFKEGDVGPFKGFVTLCFVETTIRMENQFPILRDLKDPKDVRVADNRQGETSLL